MKDNPFALYSVVRSIVLYWDTVSDAKVQYPKVDRSTFEFCSCASVFMFKNVLDDISYVATLEYSSIEWRRIYSFMAHFGCCPFFRTEVYYYIGHDSARTCGRNS
jgi:hypothetical protein